MQPHASRACRLVYHVKLAGLTAQVCRYPVELIIQVWPVECPSGTVELPAALRTMHHTMCHAAPCTLHHTPFGIWCPWWGHTQHALCHCHASSQICQHMMPYPDRMIACVCAQGASFILPLLVSPSWSISVNELGPFQCLSPRDLGILTCSHVSPGS